VVVNIYALVSYEVLAEGAEVAEETHMAKTILGIVPWLAL